MDVESLFQRIADAHCNEVRALELREDYARLLVLGAPPSEEPHIAEIFPYEAKGPDGASVPLVLVQTAGMPVLVSPTPSAVLAVILR